MIVAITGGIGSGKSFVSNRLIKFGIKVYDSDSAAKRLLRTSTELQHAVSALIGKDIIKNGILQKQLLSEYLLLNKTNANKLNNIIHPAVANDFEQSDYKWIETAILFSSGFINRIHIDKVVCVTAPQNLRIERIMNRNSVNKETALKWINSQMSQNDIISKSDFIIINDSMHELDSQIITLLKTLSS